ncbi:MAG: ROK family protein [bacterium]|nr:ROK family protein [bacterium]
MHILGIDIGGTGIKGAPVDSVQGELLTERVRINTPQPSTPEACAQVILNIVQHFGWQGPIGIGYPGVIRHGAMTLTAANMDAGWIGLDARELLERATDCPVTLINDADAAGLAEMRFGAGRDHRGVVMMLTIGTGIGSALFVNGTLVPNTELGHLKIRDKDAEKRASDRARIEKELTWKEWAKRFDEYLLYVESLFWPDLFILGGGGSKNFDKYAEFLTAQTPIVTAALLNDAGIVGAAMEAYEHHRTKE